MLYARLFMMTCLLTHVFITAIEKRLTSPLLEPASVQKVMEIDTHIGAAVSGTHLLYR